MRFTPPFLALCSVGFLALTGYAMARTPVLPYYAEVLGVSPFWAGLVVSASTITGIFLKAPAGALSDALGRRAALFLAMLVFAVPPFIYLAVTNFGQLLALRFLHGLATAIFGPVAAATVADLFRQNRGEAMAWFTSAVSAGKLLGPALGGFVLYSGFGTGEAEFGGYHFYATFLVAGLLGVAAFAAVVLWLLPVMGQAAARDAAARDAAAREGGAVQLALARMVRGLREVAGDARVLAASGADSMAYFANGALELFLPFYGLAIGLDSRQVGLLWSVQVVAALVARPLLGRLSDRMGRRPLILLGLVVIAAALVAVPWLEQLPWLILLFGVYGLGQAVVDSSTTALVADLSQQRNYGAAMGVQGTLYDVGHAAGPLAAGLIIDHYGYQATFLVVAGLLLLTALTFSIATRGGCKPGKS